MKVAMLAVGSRGDIQPYTALAMGLEAVGYDVTLATHVEFKESVENHGLRFAPLAGDPRGLLATEQGKVIAASGRNPISFVLHFRDVFAEYAEEFFEQSLAACEGADAIIYSLFSVSGYHIAEKMGVPSMPGFLTPMSRTAAFPLQPPPSWLRSDFYNWSSFVGAQQLFGQSFRGIMNRWRTRRLGLPPLPLEGLFSMIDRRHLPVLYGYSPTILPKPRDWGPSAHVTGYWFLDRQPGWQPPAALVDFLASGPPPVYVGFGSMTTQDPNRTTQLVIDALRKAGQRGVLLRGWAGLHRADLPRDFYLVDSIPHEWLLPQCCAVVHHGGAGTTGAGARSGRPSFAIPFFADQFFWGERLARIGVGPRPIGQDKLTVDNLAAAIRTAVTDDNMRRRAAAVGKRIQAEDGVRYAVAAFTEHVSGGAHSTAGQCRTERN